MAIVGGGAAPYLFSLQAARGAIPGVTSNHKFGSATDVSTTEAEVWNASAAYTGFLQSASAVRVKAGGNAADAAAGSGARTVNVSGLDENWQEAEETITLNADGTLASAATTTTFIRVFRAFVETCGDYTAPYNVGAITIETTGGAVVAIINAARGQTTQAIWTVPDGQTAYLMRTDFQASTSRTVTFRIYQRQNADDVSAPVTARRLVQEYPGVDSTITIEHNEIQTFPARTDFWVTAQTSSGTANVSAQFEMFLVAD